MDSIVSANERTPLIPTTKIRSAPPTRNVSQASSSGFDRSQLLPERIRGVSEQGGPPRIVPPRDRTFSASDVEVELDGCAGGFLCHPQRIGHRLLALMLMCLLGFGSYFCFDNPGALQKQMKVSMRISTSEFAGLYAWYNWPNVVLPIVGGFLMDRVLGIRWGTIVFSIFILLGQGVVALGGFMDKFWVMEIGRFIFGIGGESLAVAQNTYAVAWFKGKELNMVFGFQLSIARVGSTVNFLVMGPLYEWLSELICPLTAVCPRAIGWAFLIAGGSCIMSLICSVLLGMMDKRRAKLLNLAAMETGEVVKITDVKTFPMSFWFLSLTCLAYYAGIFPFISLGQDFFIEKFNMTNKDANFITGLPYLVSAPASPALGFLIDKTGRNITYCLLSIIASAGCHALLTFTMLSPYIAIITLGVAYSLLASALWPIAALVIPEYQLGTAYGLMQAIQNLGLALITLAAGSIVDDYGYYYLELFFMFWLGLALVSTVCMWICDCTTSGYLNMSIEAREKYDQARLDAVEASRVSAHHKLLQPRTVSSLRNRYLSRIGATLPGHLGHSKLILPNQLHTPS